MQPYQQMECEIKLVGNLKSIKSEKIILLERARNSIAELYVVHIDKKQYQKIYQFGFVGMSISVLGDFFEIDQKIEIFAKKIDFLLISHLAQFDTDHADSDNYFGEKEMMKLKESGFYKSKLYYQAMRSVH